MYHGTSYVPVSLRTAEAGNNDDEGSSRESESRTAGSSSAGRPNYVVCSAQHTNGSYRGERERERESRTAERVSDPSSMCILWPPRLAASVIYCTEKWVHTVIWRRHGERREGSVTGDTTEPGTHRRDKWGTPAPVAPDADQRHLLLSCFGN